MYIIVMKNIMPPDTSFVGEVYDLKGSTTGRSTPQENRKPGVPLKDLDFTYDIHIGEDIKNLVIERITRDSTFLEQHQIMDYSLLLGVHDKARDVQIPLENDQFLFQCTTTDKNKIVFIGIIDFLIQYNSFKKFEHTVKSFTQEKNFSVQPPPEYANRFINYMKTKILA